MTGKQILIGLGFLAVGITIVVLVNKNKEEPKGEGEVTAETKKVNKIVFTKNK
jgi:hypothetical protein